MSDEAPDNDPINPEHYKAGGAIECIDAIRAALTPEEFIGFCTGNAMKYLFRWRNKGGLTDLKKARWYLDRIISDKEAGHV